MKLENHGETTFDPMALDFLGAADELRETSSNAGGGLGYDQSSISDGIG